MTQQQRLNALLELVSERGNVTIAEIGEALGISAATARRDLTTLAEQRLVTRTHGGAAALGSRLRAAAAVQDRPPGRGEDGHRPGHSAP